MFPLKNPEALVPIPEAALAHQGLVPVTGSEKENKGLCH